MERIVRRCDTRIGATLALFLMLMALVAGTANAVGPIADPDFTTLIVDPADLQKYVSPLPNAYLLQIAPDPAKPFSGEDYYKVDMGQFNHDMQLLLTTTAATSATYPAASGGKLPLTPSWGYGVAGAYTFPGPTIVNTQGTPTRVTWTNSLPAKHVLNIDPTLVCGPEYAAGNINGPPSPFTMNAPNCAPENRVVVHTHGAHVWDDSDGDPLAWFSSNFAVTGETWKPNTQHGPVGTYRYINDQEAGTIWYHDHAMGMTHLNVYAGLAGFFLITDNNEKAMQAYTPGVTAPVLPSYAPNAPYEIPIALQDRKFNPDGTLAVPNNPVLDITATIGSGVGGAGIPCDATPGALAPYACTGSNPILPPTTLCDPAGVINALMCPAAKFSKAADGSLIPYTGTGPFFSAPSITPEFFGNVALANGIVWPKQDVEARKYRIRLLNGADSRTFFLKFDNPLVTVWQIGTDQAFLDKPIDRTDQFMVLMPGERIDLIVDFTAAAPPTGSPSTRVILQNYGSSTCSISGALPTNTVPPTCPTAADGVPVDIPYDGVYPVATGINVQPLNITIPDVLAFDIGPIANNSAVPDATISLTTQLRPATPAFTNYAVTGTSTLTPTPTAPVRKLALIERQGSHGRFMLTLDGRDFMDPFSPITELPKLGETEEWEIANFTPDAHPMHLHLVAFQLVNRQEFSVDPTSPTKIYDPAQPPLTRYPLMPYTAMPTYSFVAHNPADLNYAPVGTTATPLITPDPWERGWKDTLQMLPGTVTRIRAKFDLPGLYVWHCHILSHEENDMMRPFIVTTPAKSVTATLTRPGVVLASGTTELASLATPITIKAQGLTGLVGAPEMSPQLSNGFEYKFTITDPGGIKTVVQPFIAWMYPMLDSFTWTPPKNSGTYTIQVDARQAAAKASGTPGEVMPTPFTATYTLTGPAAAGATSTTATGFYKAGSVITVGVAFNQAISSTAGLNIVLNNGVTLATGALVNQSSFSSSFTVAAGQDTPTGKFLDIASITGTITDAVGNSVTNPTIPTGSNISNSVQITIDTVQPTIAVTAPTAAYVNTLNPTITGTATDLGGIQGVTVNGAAATMGAGGSFTASVTLIANSANTITIIATDLAGNTATTVMTLNHDSTLPTVNVTAPTSTFVNNVNQTVTCTATDPAGILSVTVNGAAATLANGVYSAAITLTANTINTFTVVATDLAGNITTVTKTVTHNTVMPTVTITSPASEYVNSVSQTVAGTVTSVAGIQSVTMNGVAVILGSGGTFSVPFTLTANSVNTISIVVTDLAGNVTTSTRTVIHDSILPVVTATPGQGLFSGAVTVTLTSKPGATIYYTTNGLAPSTINSTIYSGPFTLTATKTTTILLKYFAVDLATNVGLTGSGSYILHTTDLTAKVAINNGAAYTKTAAVTLAISASDKLKVAAYAISTDNGVTYLPTVKITPVVTYSAKVPVTLPGGDGLKSVYVVFTDALGVVYAPVVAQITLDTASPVTTVSPFAGNYPGGTLKISFATTEAKATIYYTTNGTPPTTASKKYGGPFDINGTNTTVTVKYFAVDKAGNQETVKSADYIFGHTSDMTATVKINGGAKYTKSANVLLSFSVADPLGVDQMSFSNNGINFTSPVAYASATAMPWVLDAPGVDGRKTVYFRFTDKATVPNIYTFTDRIVLATGVTSGTGDVNGDGKVDISDALKAMQSSAGLIVLTAAEQARGDVGPLVNGKPQPDGVIDTGDAVIIANKALGLVTF